MIILGIDPGLATLGWGVIETLGAKNKMVNYGALITRPGATLPRRLNDLFEGVTGLIETYRPDEMAFEELFFAKNVTTGMTVGAARGVALVACARRTDQIYEYTPMQIKQAVSGWGRADKKQMQQMVKMLLNLPEIPRPDDAADALAVALTHASVGIQKSEFKVM